MKRLHQSLCGTCYFSAGDKCDATHDIDGVYLQSTKNVKKCPVYVPDYYNRNKDLIISLLDDIKDENKATRDYIIRNIKALVSEEFK